MSWRQRPDEAAGVGAGEPHDRVGDVAAERGAIAVAAKREGRVAQGERLHRLGHPAGEADRLRGADLVADEHESLPAEPLDLGDGAIEDRGDVEPAARHLGADAGTSKLATSAHSSSAGLVRIHSTSVTEGINSRRGRVTGQSNHGKGPR